MTPSDPDIERAIFASLDANDVVQFKDLLNTYPEYLRHEDGRNRWLKFAVGDGQLAFVEYLVGLGADVNEPAEADSEPSPEGVIIRAARSGHLEVVRWLLDRGAVVNHVVDGQTRCFALTGAARRGHLDVVRLLVDRGAAVNACWAEMTPLDHAEMYGQAEVASYLRSVGAKRAAELA